eukprot:CAMPEP_0198215824 /NCGR_PEP_ID=MMETSP1445-20131203/52988_1 /TAXON_ID=36898 /ORGANISM="Pyramimonas sp., Strain CCMP2087" /LENGTH=186 /DNA_ID=CAMNT_0043891751 /DNA_START=41 /DNA_END=601 /DNA_ORIENTATION=-
MPSNFGNYYTAGTGRDSYVYTNNGGNSRMSDLHLGKGLGLRSYADARLNYGLGGAGGGAFLAGSHHDDNKEYSLRSYSKIYSSTKALRAAGENPERAGETRQQRSLDARLSAPKHLPAGTFRTSSHPVTSSSKLPTLGRTTCPYVVPLGGTTSHGSLSVRSCIKDSQRMPTATTKPRCSSARHLSH